ncbi:MAG: hypothetical protein OXC41_07450 [Gammaproteobacteria bacterium]|nr:hypothetical protein [Gammaproteobacteria bacterium]
MISTIRTGKTDRLHNPAADTYLTDERPHACSPFADRNCTVCAGNYQAGDPVIPFTDSASRVLALARTFTYNHTAVFRVQDEIHDQLQWAISRSPHG